MATQTDKPIVLYTFPTPNGVVPAILLEELKVSSTVEAADASVLNHFLGGGVWRT